MPIDPKNIVPLVDGQTLEERAKRAAAYVMADPKTVTVSNDGIRAMAEFIHGPAAARSVSPLDEAGGSPTDRLDLTIGSCPICFAPAGQCIAERHGYAKSYPPKSYDTTDGKPPAPGLESAPAPQPINEKTGQHKAYWVLSAEEIAKGLVRPVRDSYKHTECGVVTTMSAKLALTYARDPKFYGSTFCVGCKGHFPVGEFTWEPVGSSGPEIVGS